MKFATLSNGQVVGSDGGGFRAVAVEGLDHPPTMTDVMAHYPGGVRLTGEAMELPEKLASPVRAPQKVWAAASNYHRIASKTSDGKSGRGQGSGLSKEMLLQTLFLKPVSAIVGSGHDIVLPPDVGNVFPELELCIVIGKRCKGISVQEARDAVFGYTILIDVTARAYAPDQSGRGMRCVRKGYDTFAPVGPVIVTADEIADPQNLRMVLTVNGVERQNASTETMINQVYELVSFLSGVSTLEPGDLIATGTPDSPAHQEKFADGDLMVGEIEGVGTISMNVRAA